MLSASAIDNALAFFMISGGTHVGKGSRFERNQRVRGIDGTTRE